MTKIPFYQKHERGTKSKISYRIYYANGDINKAISPFHDISYKLETEDLYNMVVEIPRWSNAKMEIATREVFNPIKQDVKKGLLRYVPNIFPFHGYVCNYGAIPQTWENASKEDPETGYKGDNDPIDVCEIGSKLHEIGDIIQVKILGCFALIDENETDWKLVALDVEDPLSNEVNNLNDVEHYFPGILSALIEWFRIYKVPDGKPENTFALNGQFKEKEFAIKVLERCHQEWRELIENKIPNDFNLCLHNTSLLDNPNRVADPKSLLENVTGFSPGPGLTSSDLLQINKWSYVKRVVKDIKN